MASRCISGTLIVLRRGNIHCRLWYHEFIYSQTSRRVGRMIFMLSRRVGDSAACRVNGTARRHRISYTHSIPIKSSTHHLHRRDAIRIRRPLVLLVDPYASSSRFRHLQSSQSDLSHLRLNSNKRMSSQATQDKFAVSTPDAGENCRTERGYINILGC